MVFQPAKRKKKSRLSATQLRHRREHEADQSAIYNLTLDVNDLRQQLRELEEQRSLHATRLLLARQRFQDQAVDAAALFFSIFLTGFRAFNPRELAFLRARIAPDVGFASSRGLDAFLDQWRRYKVIFQQRVFRVSTIRVVASFDPEPQDEGDGDNGNNSGEDAHNNSNADRQLRLDALQGCVLECLGEFEAILTRDAIDVVFSHVSHNAALAERLEGAHIVCPTHTFIYFDDRGRIVDYDAHADFFAALNGVQGLSPMDVICVMANARISSEGSLVPALPESASSPSSASEDSDLESMPSVVSSTDSNEDVEAGARASRKRHSLAYLLS